MTENEVAAGKRVSKLSKIRKQLVILKSDRERMLEQLEIAAKRLREKPTPPLITWPSSEEYRLVQSKIRKLQKEADVIIKELRELGIDADLFKLNGD